MRISLKEKVGEYCVERKNEETHKDGASILALIRDNWHEEDKFIISFDSIKAITPSFLDEAFGKLVMFYEIDELRKKLEFESINGELKSRINQAIVNRLKQKINGQV